MSDEKLYGVLQQLVSAGKPAHEPSSFADILSSNPPTNHPSLLPLFEADMTDSELKFVFSWPGAFYSTFPQSLCYHFEEELCYPSPTLSSLTHYDWSAKLCRVLYDASVWPTTPLWPNHTPRLLVHVYEVMVSSDRSPVYQYNYVEWHCQLLRRYFVIIYVAACRDQLAKS